MSISYELVELRASKACHLTCLVNRTSELLGEWNPDAIADRMAVRSLSRRLRLMDSPARKELNRARLVFAMNNVNADVRGPPRMMARVDGHSDSRGH